SGSRRSSRSACARKCGTRRGSWWLRVAAVPVHPIGSARGGTAPATDVQSHQPAVCPEWYMSLPAHVVLVFVLGAPPAEPLTGFRKSPWFGEQVRERWLDGGVRVLVNAPAAFDPKKPTRLVVYATPNGNTIEQTLGCGAAGGL